MVLALALGVLWLGALTVVLGVVRCAARSDRETDRLLIERARTGE